MKVDLRTVEDYCEKNRNKAESRLQYFKRVLANIFTANPWIIYREDQYITEDKEGNLSRFQKLEDGKDEHN